MNRPDHVAQSVERRASIPEVVGSIPTVVGQPAQCSFHLLFQPAQSSVVSTQSGTLISYTPE